MSFKMLWNLAALPFRILRTGGGALIYFPRQYKDIPEYIEYLQSVERLEFFVRGNRQTAFIDWNQEAPPARIWFLFGGNGALALDWLPITSYAPESGGAFIYLDYPSYGYSEGVPSPKSIRSSVDQLIVELAKKFKLEESAFVKKMGVVGHSLGAAIAMDTASRYRIEHVLLISPFTSLKELSRRVVGRFFSLFLRHNFDNREAIEKWKNTCESSRRILLYHGRDDELIPISMSEELKTQYSDLVELHCVAGGDHNGIIIEIKSEINEFLTSKLG
jgi:pimeloyl-ACP methyl ester carboxylesterase